MDEIKTDSSQISKPTALDELKESADKSISKVYPIYGELIRIQHNEPRKFDFAITKEECHKAISNLYEVMDCYNGICSLLDGPEADVYETKILECKNMMEVFNAEISKPTPATKTVDADRVEAIPLVKKPTNVTTQNPSSSEASKKIADTMNASTPKVTSFTPETLEVESEIRHETPRATAGTTTPIDTKPAQTIPPVQPVDPAVKDGDTDEKKTADFKTWVQANVHNAEKTIPAPVQSDNEESNIDHSFDVVTPETKPIEMAVETPETDEPSVIVAKDDLDATPEEMADIEEDSADNGPIVSGDDDLDVSSKVTEEDLSNIQIYDKQDAIADEARRKKAEEYDIDIPEDKILYTTSKAVSRKKTNNMLAKLSKLDTSKFDIKKVTMFDYDNTDEAFRKEYMVSRNNMIAAPRTARVSLLMSGHYEEVSSYGNWDLATIGRKVADDSGVDFVDRELALYNSVYSHILYVSYAKTVPDFDTWAKNIFYPDAEMLFFGVYDANSVGINNYYIDCPSCGKSIKIPRENKDLAVAVSKEFSKDQLEKFITCSDIMKVDSTPLTKWAQNTVIRKQLNNTKYVVEYSVPTLYDYFKTIATLRRISKKNNFDIDISNIETWNDQNDASRILLYMYISRIGIPSPVKDKPNTYKYIGLTDKADIIELVNALDSSDYNQLISSNDIVDLIARRAAEFYIENAVCDECKHVIKHIRFDPKDAFFLKIGEVRKNLQVS